MKRLNQLRIDAGCSIADLARLMRVDQSTVCSWLCGQVSPDADQRRKLAYILHADPHSLDDEPEKASRAGRLRGRISTAGSKLFHQHPSDHQRPGA